jgi:hypothetical protein
MRAGAPLLGWGAALAALALGLLAWSGTAAGPWLLLAAAATSTVVAGFAIGVTGRSQRERPVALPGFSLSPTVAALGVLLVLTALAAGRWLVLVGLGVTALGVGGIVRELRAQRRELRR